ncbi:MAG: hypothetical protein AAGB11_08280 [Pseudomonadota bacterium]
MLFAGLPHRSAAHGNTSDAKPYTRCTDAHCTCLDADGNPTECSAARSSRPQTIWFFRQYPVVQVSGALSKNASIGNEAYGQLLASTLLPLLGQQSGGGTPPSANHSSLN